MKVFKSFKSIITTLKPFWTLVFCCASSRQVIFLLILEKPERSNFTLVLLNYIGEIFES